MARKSSLDSEIGGLYHLPMGEFTAARNSLATRLKKAGDGDGARTVRALAKPSASAWAVTQLLGREPERMGELLAAGKEARAAQRQAMAGRGGEAFREALERARRLVDELRREAEAILVAAGRGPSAPVVERLAADLQALAFLAGAAETIRRGYLETDLEAPGFEVLAALQLAATPRPVARGGRPTSAGHAARGGAPAVRGRQPAPGSRTALAGPRGAEPVTKVVADGRKRWDEAVRARREREVAQAKDRVESAESEVARTEAEAAFRRAAAKQAERAAADAAKQAKAAREAADAASDRAARARAELARAREALTTAARRDRPPRRSS